MMDKVSSRQLIAQLVERFSNNHKFYTSQQYNETEARVQFVNPFFEALGWDIADSTGRHEVFHEDIVEVEEEGRKRAKRPDYGFRLHNQIRFFVETKKPSVNLRSNPIPAFQVRRYGWSARLPISILTDFEEFIIYDCRIQPNENDQPSKGRLRYYTYTEYLDKWDEIYDLLSYEAVQANKLEAWVQESKQRGTVTVDDAFLNEMEEWRKRLAEDIAMNNPTLTRRQLNMAVQATIDRIVFLRICEDRGIEPNGRLKDFGRGSGVYANLTQLFRQADAKYNSGLFHFREEKDREEPDNITLNLTISDDILQDIISRLYYPSPYAFSVIPADILGQIYERFLGKVIELTPGGGAEVVEKPEVRKAGGVYYTPTYIVDYIVSNTVGQLVEGKTPDSVAALRILDPACGSGSFLIGAYQYLLDWHLDYYSKHDPNRHLKAKKVRTLNGEGSGYALTTAEKKRILINNIYGVDLDQQAVEVTKLSLLLKVLEGETAATAQPQLMAERVLPDLGENIKWGNSLIGPDYYIGKQIALFEEEELDRVKTFDWYSKASGFGEIMRSGGFDVVIGNPPYGADLDNQMKSYFLNTFHHQEYQLDSYLLFIEKGIELLKHNGYWGMIIPNPWLTNLLTRKIRKFVFNLTRIKCIVHFDEKVFSDATVDTEIVITQKTKPTNNTVTIYRAIRENLLNSQLIQQDKWIELDGNTVNILVNDDLLLLLAQINQYSVQLKELCKVTVGIKPYQVGKGTPPQTRDIVKQRIYDANKKIDNSYRRYLRGKDINRYTIIPLEDRWISYGVWLAEPRFSANFDAPEKLFMRQTGDTPIATLDIDKYLCLNNMHVIELNNPKYNIRYVLGLLNSSLVDKYYESLNPEKGEALAEVKKTNVERLPIRKIDFENSNDIIQHDRMVTLVETMLSLHKQLANAPNDSAHKTIQSLIDSTDREIDNLVYELYDLTPEEIALIEG